MIFSLDLLTEALLFGVLLGCFYAAVSIGLSVSFGLLDVPHVAHPAVMVLGSYCTYVLASQGLDPIVAGVVLMPAFGLTVYLSKTFTGRAIKAVAQDEPALRLMGANPVRIKQWAFGIATGVSALAGAMLIIVSPVEPALDRLYIGRTFCVVVEPVDRSEEHTSELQSRQYLVCRLLLEKKKTKQKDTTTKRLDNVYPV